MSKGTILRNLKTKHLKKNSYIGFDIETHGKNNDFYMGGLSFPNNKYKAYYDKESLIKDTIKHARKFNKTKVVATNLSFDFYGLYGETKYWNEFDLILKQGKLLRARYQKNHRQLDFIDTFNYIKMSVANLGKIIGSQKLTTPKVIKNDEKGYARKPKNQKERIELERYNQRDCEISRKFMEFLQEKLYLLGGKTKLTIASSSLDLFRRKYQKKWWYKEDYQLQRKPENSINKFIFESYSGGRTETFIRGRIKKPVNVYDINSMYPNAMLKEFPHPDSVKISKNPDKKVLEFEGCSLVTLQTPKEYYPYLPKRKKNKHGHTEKLLFPNGLIRGVYTHFELRKALEKGYKIIDHKYSVYYTRTFTPFKEFIETLYDLRLKYKKEKNPMELVIKMVLNSSYGKFAERKAESTKIVLPEELSKEEYDQLVGTLDLTRSGYLMSTEQTTTYRPHQIPILASYITAYSRDNLYHYLNKYKGLYCDTDSIFTYKEIPESNKLGGMKLEYTSKESYLVKPKMYMLKIPDKNKQLQYKVRLKGVSRPNQKTFNDILDGKKIYYDSFMTIKSGLRRDIRVNSIYENEKFIKLEDTKRIWYEKFNREESQKSDPLIV